MDFKDTFFEEEIRCGYTISSKMKRVWAVELEMLERFIEVCEKNNLNYFLDGGTLLGAVRHQGFIPWDDDIDVIMPRKDYECLCQIADKEFEYPYFFQTTLTEKGFFRTHAQLRNSDTTGFIAIDGKKDINRGIFMDIFVLDNIPDGILKKKFFKYNILIKKRVLAYMYDREYENLSLKGKTIYTLVHSFFRIYPFRKFFVKFNKTLAKYRNKDTTLVGDITLQWRSNVQWPKKWYDGYSYLSFEGLRVRVPLFYKEILTRQYGNFMKLPDNVHAMNGRSHGSVTFEPDIPYREYFELKK